MKNPTQTRLSHGDKDIAALADKEWRAYVEPLAHIAEKVAPRLHHAQDPRMRHELYSALFSQIATAYIGLLYADPKYPDFWPWFNTAFNNLGPNPDDVFSLTPLHDDGVYKISGFRGTVRLVDFQLGTGTFIPRGTFDDPVYSRTLANYHLDTLSLGADGAFEVVLSAKRPAGHEGDWWELMPGATYLLVRQVSYDWLNEEDARLAIERLDTPAVKPRPTAEELERNLQGIAKWVENNLKWSLEFIDWCRSLGKINQVDYLDFGKVGGHTTQKYAGGACELESDEALIVEIDVPEQSQYWSFHLTNNLHLSVDWMSRQTSINGFTARIDSDGKFRFVVSAQDPGTPNWLDTAGYQCANVVGRWKECSSWPQHKTIKAKLADVRKYLPADTPVVTVEEREAAIRLRRKAVQLRRRW